MLAFLADRLTDRKLRLYFCAWAREVWHRLSDEGSKEAVETAELFADGLVPRSELTRVFRAAHQAWKDIRVDFSGRHGKQCKSPKGSRPAKMAAEAACNAANPALKQRTARLTAWRENAVRILRLAGVLRDLFGPLPFRPAPVIEPDWLSWREGTVIKVARAIYEERAFDQLPVLADALEEAGCAHRELLGHLRGPCEHVRGCWTLDLILGKE
jgi:hypothetical protein